MLKQNVIAVIEMHQGDPKFVPMRITIPSCNYAYDMVQKVIREISPDLVHWQRDFSLIRNFVDPISKSICDSVDWNSAHEVTFDVSKYAEIHNAYRLWKNTFANYRVPELEPVFAQDEVYAEKYVKHCRDIEWTKWTDDEIIQSPVYMFYYAMKVCKGRLPEHLDNAMNMVSFKHPESQYVKRYFGTKRYRIRNGKSLLPKGMTPTDYSKSLLEPKVEFLSLPPDSSLIGTA
jgi:hypothetical protein